jgi:hypothetical protein
VLSLHKNITVVEMSRLGWGLEGRRLRWCRRFFIYEEEQVVKCYAVLENYFLQVNSNDS